MQLTVCVKSGHRDASDPCHSLTPTAPNYFDQNIEQRDATDPCSLLTPITALRLDQNIVLNPTLAPHFVREQAVATSACSTQDYWHLGLPALCFSRDIQHWDTSAHAVFSPSFRITHIRSSIDPCS
ncbi:Hypothetical predicted protein [Scomber scombrus]|uniref:Uncharacterized protein n=1 Tax=Scomber scombrus TaxID=13677 RepID=A0AAV1Q8J4_SCOSC